MEGSRVQECHQKPLLIIFINSSIIIKVILILKGVHTTASPREINCTIMMAGAQMVEYT